MWSMTALRLAAVLLFLLTSIACDDDVSGDAGPDGGDASLDGDGQLDAELDGDTDSGVEPDPTGPPPPPPQPPYSGLTADVEVLIDDLGIPHIYGQTDEDAFYGAGYMMARDRLFQMDLFRRRALGRSSEVMGEASLEDDELMRRFGFRDRGRADFERLRDEESEVYHLIVAWCAGINRFIEQIEEGDAPLPYGFGRDELDFEPEQWHPSDLIVISRMAFFSISNTLEPELLSSVMRDFFPDAFDAIELVRPAYNAWIVPPEDMPEGASPEPWVPLPEARRPARELGPDASEGLARFDRFLSPFRKNGSNNFAIDGRFTENGRPLIANDPHLGLELPNILYALHINSADGEGTLDVAGFTIIGTFGVSMGRNDRLVWTATNSFGDVMDIWDVRTTDDGVMIGDEEVRLENRREAIVVRGGGDSVGEGNVTVFTAGDVPGYGLILPSSVIGLPLVRAGHQLLLNSTVLGPFDGTDALVGLQRAQTLDEFDASIDGVGWLGFNFVAATAEGISYRVGLDVPDRGDPATMQPPYMIIDGDDPNSFWTGEVLPREQLPSGRAGTRGFITTSNNDPFGFTGDGNVLNDPWYYGALFAAGFRAKRLEDELLRLTERGDVTLEEAIALPLDVHSPLADMVAPRIAEAWSRVGEDPDLTEFDSADLATLVGLLTEEWDRAMRRDSSEALAFRSFMFDLTATVLQDDLGVVYDMVSSTAMAMIFFIRVTAMVVADVYPEGERLAQQGVDRAILEALSMTRDWLTERFGGVDPSLYAYRDAALIRLRHPIGGELDLGTFAIDGAEDTVANFPGIVVNDGGDESFEGSFGPVMRIVSSFAEDGTPESVINLAPGNSGNPSSAHFDDLLDDFVEGRHRPLPFRRGEVEDAQEELLLLPAEGSARQ